ncbi:sugar ABC transporter substrate-binding protein [Microtetraspora sp. NBRC 13810]|uniref:extracellular solute-binding protein n=1 Tax=Microtetraspora sp. NBRC 13810 TaxID=3030990 RepID=UPI0024A06F90|nr:extracellular solute-binding protein [Microtetraspora sp. NBRC 13810]GLW08139.1 sugar ABC transporter substrate-binding protein [Microtetraspora sp. NBRC 13810]
MRNTNLKIAVALLSLVSLAACGRDGGAGAEPATGAQGQNATAPANAKLVVWAMGSDGDNLPKLLKKFEAENPGYSVDVTSIPWQDAASKLRTADAGGVTPDIAQVGTTLMGGITDAFQPVPGDTDTSVYFQGPLKSAQAGGQTVGVPWVVDTRVLFYRTDLARKAGFDGPPKTWDELKAMAKGMQAQGGAKWGIRMATTPDQDVQNSFAFPWSNGAQIISQDGSKWTFDTPETVDAYRYYQSFYKEKIADPNPATGAGAAESAFVNGQLGILVAGAGESELLDQAGGPGFKDKYALATFPRQKSGTSFAGGSDLVVFKQSKNSAAAWKLVRWLSQPDVQVEWYQIDGALPAVQSAWQNPALADDKRLSVFGEQLKDTNAPPPNATWLQVSDVFGQQVEQMVKNGKDPAQAMKDAQTAADGIGTGS